MSDPNETSGDRLARVRPVKRFELLWKALALEGGMLALGWLLADALGFSFLGQLNMSWSTTGLGLLATSPVLAVAYGLARSNLTPLARLRQLTLRVIGALFAESNVYDLALISLLAGLGEEALFRGALQPWLGSLVGVTASIVVVGLVFGFVHYLSLAYALYASAMGVYLGVLAVATGSLWAPMVVHAVYDFIGLWFVLRLSKANAGAA